MNRKQRRQLRHVEHSGRAPQPAGPAARVFVATPSYDCTTHWRYTESMTAAFVYAAYHRVELELNLAARFTLIQYARNYLVQQFLADDSFTHMLWVDADLGFDPRAPLKLLQAERDVVAGVYPVKTSPAWFPFEPTGEIDGELVEAKTLPTGFLLVSRAAIEAVAAPAPVYTLYHGGREIPCPHVFDLELETRDDGRQVLVGEDVVLCKRLRALGYRLWVDPSLPFRHCGMNEWAGRLADSFQDPRRANTAEADDGRPVAKAASV